MKLSVFILFILHSTIAMKNYSGYSLLRSVPLTEDHVQFLRNVSQVMDIDYWRSPGAVRKPVDILVSPDEKSRLLKFFGDKQYNYTTVMDDVQRAFDKQTIKPYIRRNMDSFDFKNFFQLSDIYSWMHDIAKAFPDEAKVFSLGKTHEQRDILGMSINLTGSKLRSTVVVEGGIHAREWIAPAVVCYMISQIVYSKNSKDEELRNIALMYEWYFVPVLNPDGYAYSFEHDRLWRKNRYNGHGVDLNRNFDIEFGSVGVSNKTNSETYCGKKAFSESESIAMKNLMTKVQRNLEYYMAFHSYGHLMVIPYSYTKKHFDNYDKVSNVLLKVKTAISRRFGTQYTYGTAFDTVGIGSDRIFPIIFGGGPKQHHIIKKEFSTGYITSGVSGCWVKKEFRVPYVVTFELRDDGTHGFALPPDQIIPTCTEIMDGLKVLLLHNTSKEPFQKFSEKYTNGQSCCFVKLEIILFNVLLIVKSFSD